MTLPKLLEDSAAVAAALEILDRLDQPDYAGTVDDTMLEAMAEIEEDLHAGLDALAAEVRKAEAKAIGQAEELDALAAVYRERIQAHEARAERLTRLILYAMKQAGIAKVEGDLCRFRRQRKPDGLETPDENKVPARFWVQPPIPPRRIDRAAIRSEYGGKDAKPAPDWLKVTPGEWTLRFTGKRRK